MITVNGARMTIAKFQAAQGLSVGGSLYLSGTAITALPEGLSVGRSLYLSGTAITALPEGLSVGGSLCLSGSAITALPEGLSVGGSLYLSDTAITALPEGLSVAGSLYLSGTAYATKHAVGEDRRGFVFVPVRLQNGWRVIAGCRNFSAEEARAHWPEGSECLALAERCIVRFEEHPL